TPSPLSTDCASSTAPASSTSLPERLTTSTWISLSNCSPTPLSPCLLGVPLVRLDDPLHELVTDDVLVGELDERDAVDRREDLAHLDQAGCLLARQVDLGHVPGHDHLRAEAEPGQEHLHLFRRRVLCLVEDHEAVVEGAPAHEGKRSHLDRAALHVGVESLRIHRVV